MNYLLRPLKYVSAFSLASLALLGFWLQGIWTYLPLIEAFVFIPLLELFLRPDQQNLSQAEEEMLRKDRLYDWVIYLTVPLQFLTLGVFLYVISHAELATYEWIGMISGMGVLCGTYGINVGHELGHRKLPYERFLAKASLLSSLYLHFFIEHNRGHHKRVSTQEDPASARYGEWIYLFWFRSVLGGYFSAWELEAKRLRQRNQAVFSWQNEMIRFQLIQVALLLLIGFSFGLFALFSFLLAALMGILLLETVNYIEHYGLQRKKLDDSRYERVLPHHSWNSDHVLGRLVLFELSRHSDHHYLASRKYQILRHHDATPQMPTGYPGMMLLALLPPLWFGVMHRKIAQLEVG